MNTIMAEMYGKANGCSGGRGGSMHLFPMENNFYGGNAIVGGGLPLAVGLGSGDKMSRKTASPPVSSAMARWPKASSTRA
jgi:2-oxoisovalerate dehydrogenase E1 component